MSPELIKQPECAGGGQRSSFIIKCKSRFTICDLERTTKGSRSQRLDLSASTGTEARSAIIFPQNPEFYS